MRIKYVIAIIIIITIIWVIINNEIKDNEAKELAKLLTGSSSDVTTITTIGSNVAEVKRYYVTNSTDTIPSGQSWVRIRNCNSGVGKIDFGGGYADLEEAGSSGDTYYTDFLKQGKVSPQIKLDAIGTKFLVEYSK